MSGSLDARVRRLEERVPRDPVPPPTPMGARLRLADLIAGVLDALARGERPTATRGPEPEPGTPRARLVELLERRLEVMERCAP